MLFRYQKIVTVMVYLIQDRIATSRRARVALAKLSQERKIAIRFDAQLS